jgi:hypothetical protein
MHESAMPGFTDAALASHLSVVGVLRPVVSCVVRRTGTHALARIIIHIENRVISIVGHFLF